MNVKRFLIILFSVIALISSSIYAMSIRFYVLSVVLMTAAFLSYFFIFSESDDEYLEEDRTYSDYVGDLVRLSKFEERKSTSHRTYHR